MMTHIDLLGSLTDHIAYLLGIRDSVPGIRTLAIPSIPGFYCDITLFTKEIGWHSFSNAYNEEVILLGGTGEFQVRGERTIIRYTPYSSIMIPYNMPRKIAASEIDQLLVMTKSDTQFDPKRRVWLDV